MESVIGPLERMEKDGCCRDLVVYGYGRLENHEIVEVQRRAMWGLRRLKVKRTP